MKDIPVVRTHLPQQKGFVIDIRKIHPGYVEAADGSQYLVPSALLGWALSACAADLSGRCEFGVLNGRWYAEWLAPL